MKFNSREIAVAASLPNPDKEGKLAYKKPQKGSGFKDKWFRLKGNLLFYYSWDSISTGSTFDFSSPQGVIVLERIRVQHEPHHPEQSFVFSISFEPLEGYDSHMGSFDYASVAKAKHYFSGRTLEDCEDWVQMFRHSSTETLKSHILVLQAKIVKMTGVDPLDAFYLNPKVEFRNTGGGLKLHHVVDILNPPQKNVEDSDLSCQRLDDDVEDKSNTLTHESTTLTNVSSVVPVIVVEAGADEFVSDATPASPQHPCRPSVLAEAQRLHVVDDAAAASVSSDSSSNSSSSSTNGGAKPKAMMIKTAAKLEKREKMPTSRKAPNITTVRETQSLKLSKTTTGFLEENEANDGGPGLKRSASDKWPTKNEEKDSSPRAPPRLRSKSRKGSSLKKQLSLIEEEAKSSSRRTTQGGDILPQPGEDKLSAVARPKDQLKPSVIFGAEDPIAEETKVRDDPPPSDQSKDTLSPSAVAGDEVESPLTAAANEASRPNSVLLSPSTLASTASIVPNGIDEDLDTKVATFTSAIADFLNDLDSSPSSPGLEINEEPSTTNETTKGLSLLSSSRHSRVAATSTPSSPAPPPPPSPNLERVANGGKIDTSHLPSAESLDHAAEDSINGVDNRFDENDKYVANQHDPKHETESSVPKPKPRVPKPSNSSSKLSSLLPPPARPKRRSNGEKDNDKATPKTKMAAHSSFKSFLYEDEYDGASESAA